MHILIVILISIGYAVCAGFAFHYIGLVNVSDRYHSEKYKFMIVSKTHFFRCLIGGLVWPLSIGYAFLEWTLKGISRVLQKFNDLPLNDPKKLNGSNEI